MPNRNQVQITVILTTAQAEAYSQFLKRSGYSDYQFKALDKAEAYDMVDAGEVLRTALAEAGYSPR
jgi:hypothetical protein